MAKYELLRSEDQNPIKKILSKKSSIIKGFLVIFCAHKMQKFRQNRSFLASWPDGQLSTHRPLHLSKALDLTGLQGLNQEPIKNVYAQ